jgi:hypothetical protein
VALRSIIWPTFNFNGVPTVSLGMASRDVLIDEVIEVFWGGIVTSEEKSLATDDLHQLIDDLLLNEANTATTTRNVVKGVCTTVLASAHVTLL